MILQILPIIGLILIIIGIGLNIYDGPEVKSYSVVVMCGIILVSVSFTLLIERKKPSALDVYRGKTTLTVTYQDTIPIDSTVIFKNTKNGK